jgi:hypothetical protein
MRVYIPSPRERLTRIHQSAMAVMSLLVQLITASSLIPKITNHTNPSPSRPTSPIWSSGISLWWPHTSSCCQYQRPNLVHLRHRHARLHRLAHWRRRPWLSRLHWRVPKQDVLLPDREVARVQDADRPNWVVTVEWVVTF